MLTAIGGGGGASPAGVGGNGTAGNGASGGGGSGNQPNINSGGSGTSGQGSNGGNGYSFSMRSGGGGGGAGSVGTAGTDGVAGIGGAGATSTITGTSTVYAKGGSGIVMSCCGGHAGASGAANTGNGGDAGHTVGAGTPAGSGGSGIVVIRYASTSLSATGGTVTTGGGDVIHTFTSSGTFTVVSVGGSEYATSSESYVYNSVGNITAANTTGATTTYSYANTGYANPHAVTSIVGTATTTYSYDNNGNLTSVTSAASTTNYTYDYANRMSQVVGNGATSTYAYDHAGQRVKQEIWTDSSTTTPQSITIYPNKFYSITSTTIGTTTYATSTAYIWAGDTMVAYVEQDLINGTATGTPRTFYVHPDHLGSTNVITDQNGGVALSKDYLPYGSTRIESGTASLARGYIGEFEEGNNLSYLNARFYQSDRGQFLRQDPVFQALGNPGRVKQLTQREQYEILSDPQMLNSYSYARNNPIANKDPEGAWASVALQAAIRIYGAFSLGFGGGEVLNANLLFPNDYSGPQRSEANFYFGLSVITAGAGPFAKTPLEQAVLELGPDIVRIAEDYGGSNSSSPLPQNQAQFNPLFQYTSNYPGLGPSLQKIYTQIQSTSIQQRYQAAQTYNATAGATGSTGNAPSPNSLWVTPNGAVVNFGGQLGIMVSGTI